MGPCVITDKPTSQQVEVLYLLNGKTSRRHFSHVTQFFRPIGTDTQRLLEYSSAPKSYQNYEGRRVGKDEREKLIQELETGLQGKTYLSAIDDLEEVDMMLKDRFSLLDYPEEYSEERTEKLREFIIATHRKEKSYEIVLPRMPKRKMSMKSSELRTLTLGMPKTRKKRKKEEKTMKKKNLGRLSLGTSRKRKTIPTIERSD